MLKFNSSSMSRRGAIDHNSGSGGSGSSSSSSEGKLLHLLLRKLNYGDLETYPSSKEEGFNLPVDPSVLDWIFHCNETSTSFILKLCNIIKSESMILTENEIKEFEELEKQGRILHGHDLEQALELGDDFYRNKDETPIEDLEKELELLNEELDILENQLEKKKIQKDKLKHYFEKLGEKQLKNVQSISMKNLEFTRILTQVKNSVEEYVKALSNHSLLNLTELNLENDGMVEENLKQLMDKFNENDAGEDNLEKHSKELNRLSSIYKTTEEQYLTSLTSYKKLQASLESANNQKEHLHNYQHLDISTIIENIEKTKKQVANLKSIVLQYITNDIPILVKDLTELNSVNVINQDYIKKIDFEQKRNEELNMIVNHVLTRYSTLRLLNECFNMEYTNIYKDYLLINCIIIELNEILQGFETRLYHYQRLSEIQLIDKQQEELSNSEDVSSSLYSIHSDLNSILSNDFQNFISNSPLKTQNLSEALRHTINETKKEIHALKLELNLMIGKVLEKNIELEKCLFHSEIDLNNPNIVPQLISKDIMEQLQFIKTQTDDLSNVMKRVLEQQAQTQHLLQTDEFIRNERDISKVFSKI
ncbi:predicted protein [Naegleria gruberi]|uniref:Predicted protein n=1 Tax=Naegleria gruberi TaxID=5762 RepID=D2VKB6_NAEGR|nr:uncharacterized protein NAEGRDRAFT_69336 [Naegleria gruberi]EFC42657.1 predicted protein [Naegleria gruberi]|eukprot:XP_002675401.1 predicted protein [Naegleria gruberi strain NEG-M]